MNKLIFSLLFFSGCATISIPEGGEKDTEPPVLLESSPDSAQLNFKGDQVELEFDEYFQVRSFNSQVIISPPFDKPLQYKVKGKKLRITFPDYLRSNTTYQIHFGESILDVNESNLLKDLKMVFSTGSYIDSSYLRGSLNVPPLISEDLSNLKALLYREYSDTNYFLRAPYYIANVDEQKRFEFNNIGPGSYQVFLLNDANSNYRYEPGEFIATLFNEINTDSSGLKLTVFKEEARKERLKLKSEITPNNRTHVVVFNREPEYVQLKIDSVLNEILTTRTSNKGDSLFIFLSNKLAQNDSVVISIITPDSTFQSVMPYIDEELSKPALHIYSAVISPLDSAKLISNVPIKPTPDISLFNITDSISVNSTIDYKGSFELSLIAKLKEGKQYRIVSRYDTAHSDSFHFQTTSGQNTSKLSFRINLTDSIPCLIQLKSRGPEAYSWYVHSDTLIKGEFLRPGSYSLIAIKDRNGDRRYTTGSLKDRRQPEEVYTLETAVELKADWESSGSSYLID